MSVLIKGMEMPDSCSVCKFAGRGGYHMERVACMFTGKNEYAIKVNRLPDCPLIALPEAEREEETEELLVAVEELKDQLSKLERRANKLKGQLENHESMRG